MEKITGWWGPAQPQYLRSVDANVVYEGWAQPGAEEDAPDWQIRRTAYTVGGEIQVDWAGLGRENALHLFRWDQRTLAPFSRVLTFTPSPPPSLYSSGGGGGGGPTHSYLPAGW